MGAGIARYLADKFPVIAIADKETTFGSKNKLGKIDIVKVTDDLSICNCYTQYRPGRDVDYDAIEKCLINIAKRKEEFDDIRTPKIGCGIAGGDWSIVEKIFETHLPNATLYVLE
jgi:O-acetyl-ADP-ribose deacetylase (regulator of RNase III)